jgi:hypothetical protein
MKTVIDRWYKKIWITRGCRFNANERYETHASYSNFTLLLLNIYVLAINLFPLIPNLKKYFPTEDTAIYTIILTVLMLSVGQFVSAKQHLPKAMRFHDCGKELSIIYDEVDLLRNFPEKVEEKDISKIITSYNTIIQKYEDNHKNIDMILFKSINCHEFPYIKYPTFYRYWVKICSFFQVTFIYWVCILLPPSGFLFYIYKTT